MVMQIKHLVIEAIFKVSSKIKERKRNTKKIARRFFLIPLSGNQLGTEKWANRSWKLPVSVSLSDMSSRDVYVAVNFLFQLIFVFPLF